MAMKVQPFMLIKDKIILGIDPGTNIMGYGLHDKFGRLRMQCGGVDKPQQCV